MSAAYSWRLTADDYNPGRCRVATTSEVMWPVALMHPDTVREPRSHQITMAQLEHGEPDPLETSLVGVDPERQVVRALRDQQLGRGPTGRAVE